MVEGGVSPKVVDAITSDSQKRDCLTDLRSFRDAFNDLVAFISIID